MKRILVIYYTQSGQLRSILDSLTKPFREAGDLVHFEEIQPVEKFPFPWSGYSFFNAFPETFFQQPQQLLPFSEKAFDSYDFIILGYQPWFLTPSRPVSSWLQSGEAQKILAGKNVVTILGCRNMWLGAQEKVKVHLQRLGASLTGHIALADRSGNLTSLITILRWMFSGKKEAFWFFPAAGVSESDVEQSAVFGSLIKQSLDNGQFEKLQEELNRKGAIDIKPNLVLLERRGQKGFSVWSKFISSGGAIHSTGRKVRVYIFMYVLPTAIFILSPLLWLVSKIMLVVMRKKLANEVSYFSQNSLRAKSESATL